MKLSVQVERALLPFFFAISSIACVQSHAQAQDLDIVSTAVPFLRISPDARGGAMGDVGIASTPDANSSLWNQAKVPFTLEKGAIGVTYTPWLGDITKDVFLTSVGGFGHIDDEQAFSASLRYFSLGNITFTDFNGNSIGASRPREFSFDAGYSRKLSQKTAIGGALRFIYSRLVTGTVGNVNYKPGIAFAADLSVFHNGTNASGQGFTWGLTLSNLGSKIGYSSDAKTKEFLPANLGGGLAYNAVLNDELKLLIEIDANKLLVPAPPNDSASYVAYHDYGVPESWVKSFGAGNGGVQSLQISGGLELNYLDQFYARTGYYWEGEIMGGRRYLSMGFGIKYDMLGFNFSYLIPSNKGVTRNPLSNTIRFGLTFDLSRKSNSSSPIQE